MSSLLRKAALSTIGGALLIATLGFAPAGAERPDSTPGSARQEERAAERAQQRRADAVTEDDDTNDGGTPNNVVDDDDNAHPSGKDRSVEAGGSGNQGAASSDPDDDGRGPDRSNGGPDKPGGAGGVDLADQDGNNGCGNDDDFEDDNEGWCGRRPERPASTDAAGSDDDDVQGGQRVPRTADALERTTPKPPGRTADALERATPPAPARTADAVERTTLAADDDEARGDVRADTDVEAVAGVDAELLAAAGETDGAPSTVSARSAGGAVLAELPVVGRMIDGELPVTGIGGLALVVLAAGALVVGGLFVRASRRSSSPVG